MTVLLDDHLLRDWMARRDRALIRAVAGEEVATTNLWYARLCKTAAREQGAPLAGWDPGLRTALMAGLVMLPDDIGTLPMRELAWTMGELVAGHQGLSTLGAEAVASALALEGRLLVSSRDDGPGIRRCCEALRVRYRALPR